MALDIRGLESINNDFDLFLIDQFGVLHDGKQPYPHAIDALGQLKLRNKQIVIVSNSGKRSAININRIAKLGFDKSLFDHFITSGEVAFHYLSSYLRDSAIKTCYLISRDNDTSAIAELGLQLVDNPDSADMILIGGSEAERFCEDHYRQMLQGAAQNKKLCVCTNPDKKMLTDDGLKFGAGRIAEIYVELGGEVQWIGKPLPLIYQHILKLYSDVSGERGKDRVLCIGDSIEHDIAGGQNVGLKTLLVRTGILADVTCDQLRGQFQHYDVTPDFTASELVF